MGKLERLTPTILRKAEAKGKVAGWYALLREGYLPDEIVVNAEPVIARSDVIHRVRQHCESHALPLPVSCARTREYRRAALPEDWRAAFRANVMRTGMVLSLSQSMLEMLCATADGVMWDRRGTSTQAKPDNFIATSGSLEKRGLIRRREGRERWEDGDSNWALTEAGEAVVQLLKAVGVFVEADESIRRKGAS